jgi:hypothetical protein
MVVINAVSLHIIGDRGETCRTLLIIGAMNWRAPNLAAQSRSSIIKNTTGSRKQEMSNNGDTNIENTSLDTSSSPLFSLEFPEDYGDFILKSRDGILLYFPRLLLAHASPVFRDMLQIGQDSEHKDTLALSEDLQTLECLLCHIDPAKKPLKLDWGTVVDLLTAADKYQISSVVVWFEREIAFEAINNPFPTLKEPVKCFQLAMHFKLDSLARLSLRQLVRCPLSEIQTELNQNCLFIGYLLSLRSSRSQQLMGFIFRLDSVVKSSSSHCSSHQSSYGWVPAAVKAVVQEPSWLALVRSVKIVPQGCGCKLPTISVDMREEAMILETTFPPLPQ